MDNDPELLAEVKADLADTVDRIVASGVSPNDVMCAPEEWLKFIERFRSANA